MPAHIMLRTMPKASSPTQPNATTAVGGWRAAGILTVQSGTSSARLWADPSQGTTANYTWSKSMDDASDTGTTNAE